MSSSVTPPRPSASPSSEIFRSVDSDVLAAQETRRRTLVERRQARTSQEDPPCLPPHAAIGSAGQPLLFLLGNRAWGGVWSRSGGERRVSGHSLRRNVHQAIAQRKGRSGGGSARAAGRTGRRGFDDDDDDDDDGHLPPFFLAAVNPPSVPPFAISRGRGASAPLSYLAPRQSPRPLSSPLIVANPIAAE